MKSLKSRSVLCSLPLKSIKHLCRKASTFLIHFNDVILFSWSSNLYQRLDFFFWSLQLSAQERLSRSLYIHAFAIYWLRGGLVFTICYKRTVCDVESYLIDGSNT